MGFRSTRVISELIATQRFTWYSSYLKGIEPEWTRKKKKKTHQIGIATNLVSKNTWRLYSFLRYNSKLRFIFSIQYTILNLSQVYFSSFFFLLSSFFFLLSILYGDIPNSKIHKIAQKKTSENIKQNNNTLPFQKKEKRRKKIKQNNILYLFLSRLLSLEAYEDFLVPQSSGKRPRLPWQCAQLIVI